MIKASEIIEKMRVIPCLSEIGDEEITAIADIAEVKTFSKNEALYVESEPAKFIFILMTGIIKLYKTSQEGREMIIKIMGPGDYFCCAPLFLAEKHLVSAMALDDSTLIVLPSARFREIIFGQTSKTGMKILTNLCNRIKYLSNLVEELSFKDVEQRVLITLLRLMEKELPEMDIVSFTLTHQDIASMTGTVREVVSRVMSRLKKERVIVESTVRGFRIDKDRLMEFSGQRLFDNIMAPNKKRIL